jgi:hypothetical protein
MQTVPLTLQDGNYCSRVSVFSRLMPKALPVVIFIYCLPLLAQILSPSEVYCIIARENVDDAKGAGTQYC